MQFSKVVVQHLSYTERFVLLVQSPDSWLYIVLHGLAGRVPDAVATYCTMIRALVNSLPQTADPLVILKTLHPFAAAQRLACLADGLLDKQLTPEEVRDSVGNILVKSAFAGQDLRHHKFCEVKLPLLVCLHKSTTVGTTSMLWQCPLAFACSVG